MNNERTNQFDCCPSIEEVGDGQEQYKRTKQGQGNDGHQKGGDQGEEGGEQNVQLEGQPIVHSVHIGRKS
uniref:Uncharacterized protein n=1 Tax=Globodera rostochiensis TaxID=31243 RepID=A0A914I2S5_GLORO